MTLNPITEIHVRDQTIPPSLLVDHRRQYWVPLHCTLSWCICTVFTWKTVVLISGWTVCASVCLALEADSSEHAAVERAQNVKTLRLGMQPQFHASSAAQLWTKYLVILVHSVLIDPEMSLL